MKAALHLKALTNDLIDLPPHLTALQVCEYIKSYAEHFDLYRDVQLNTSVEWIKRNAENARWQVCVSDGKAEVIRDFDRIVMCSGSTFKAVTPPFEGIEKLKGKVIHVQAFKRYVISVVDS
jgi:dimethylaniline monooxygenase (N-oxide forming)